MNPPRIKQDLFTLKPLHFLILLALAEGDLHGYALKKEVSRRTEGAVSPGAGSLYRAIGQLEEAGLIEESSWRPGPALDDDRRRYFRVTPLGRESASSETHRLAALVEAARASGLGR